MVETGTKNSISCVVDEHNVASTAGSGLLPVFATPFMCALMEQAAGEMVQPFLDDGMFTVGTALDITHESATPIGMTVTATATLTAIDRRALYFDVIAEDECGVIGRGKHARFIVSGEKFMAKLEQKKESLK